MENSDITLIKMITDHYWIKEDNVVRKIHFKDRIFFDKFKRVDEMLSSSVIKKHNNHEIIVAHSLINKNDKIENIVIDYNGINTEKFWHRAQLLLREEGFINFTAYESKTSGHLHLYIHKGHTSLSEGCLLANRISMKLSQRMPVEWKVFPSLDIPRDFNIITLPYKVYKKERGVSWSKHM